jgi:osmotically-inducible protein OsmY
MNYIAKILKLTALAAAFVFILSCATTQKSESTGEYIDNSAISIKVRAAIVQEPSLNILDINVETYKGVVQLSGFVDSRDQSEKAEEISKKVPGVKSVENSLVIK